MAGDGPAIDIVRAWIRNRGLEPTIDLLGQVMNRDVPALMRAADVLAAPSVSDRRWAEQVGMVLLQAMASGLPLVTTRSGSIPEFVDDGETGLLVPERDPDALSLALRRVLSDSDLCARLAENGLRVASERYDAATNVRLAEAAILAACGRSP
jgi:glycosyltransferase involved in cell wall biosynthesis